MRRTSLAIVLVLAVLTAPVGGVPRVVRVRWQPSVTPDVVGYRVYMRQTTQSLFGPAIDVGLPVAEGDGTLSATVADVDDALAWVFALSAVGAGDAESDLSNPVEFGTTVTPTTSTTSTTAPQACGGDAECDDGSACTANDRCANGFCAWEPVTCPVGQPCAPGRCDPVAGCVVEPAPPGSPCDLGDPCQPGVCTETGCAAPLVARVEGHFLSVSRFVIKDGKKGPRLVARASFATDGGLDPSETGFAFDVSVADGRVLYAASVPPEAFAPPTRRGRRLRYRVPRRMARTAAPDVRRLVLLVDDAGVTDIRLVAVTDGLARARGDQSLRWAIRTGGQCVSDPGLVCESQPERTRCS